MKGKASEEVLKQLKQEKNVAVQEATKKDAESRDMKRKVCHHRCEVTFCGTKKTKFPNFYHSIFAA